MAAVRAAHAALTSVRGIGSQRKADAWREDAAKVLRTAIYKQQLAMRLADKAIGEGRHALAAMGRRPFSCSTLGVGLSAVLDALEDEGKLRPGSRLADPRGRHGP